MKMSQNSNERPKETPQKKTADFFQSFLRPLVVDGFAGSLNIELMRAPVFLVSCLTASWSRRLSLVRSRQVFPADMQVEFSQERRKVACPFQAFERRNVRFPLSAASCLAERHCETATTTTLRVRGQATAYGQTI